MAIFYFLILGSYVYASECFPHEDVSEINICVLIVLLLFYCFVWHPVQKF